MSKRVYALVSALVGACATVAIAIVTFVSPAYAAAIVAAIGIGATAINEILQLFVKESDKNAKEKEL